MHGGRPGGGGVPKLWDAGGCSVRGQDENPMNVKQHIQEGVTWHWPGCPPQLGRLS
jgi:hypothetical protein